MQKVFRMTVASRRGRAVEQGPGETAPGRQERVSPAAAADSEAAASGWCRAALADFAPGRVVWDDPSELPIPDFDDRPMLSVSGRARGLIEAIEPAVHHFLPVVFCDGDGKVIERRYFLIVARNPETHRMGRTHLWHDGQAGEAPRLSPTLAEAIRASGMTGLCWDEPIGDTALSSGPTGRIR